MEEKKVIQQMLYCKWQVSRSVNWTGKSMKQYNRDDWNGDAEQKKNLGTGRFFSIMKGVIYIGGKPILKTQWEEIWPQEDRKGGNVFTVVIIYWHNLKRLNDFTNYGKITVSIVVNWSNRTVNKWLLIKFVGTFTNYAEKLYRFFEFFVEKRKIIVAIIVLTKTNPNNNSITISTSLIGSEDPTPTTTP